MKTLIRILSVIVFLYSSAIQAQNVMSGYEYWFNDDYQLKVVSSVIPSEQVEVNTVISAAFLPDGFHRLNIRFFDDSSKVSSTFSSFFLKRGDGTSTQNNTLVRYEYWFDQDYSQKITSAIAPTGQFVLNDLFDSQALQAGLHTFHIRFMDEAGLWSSVSSSFFFKSNSESGLSAEIVAYEYWFDSNVQATVINQLTPAEIIHVNNDISTAILEPGIHMFHIRFKDVSGQWSTVQSSFFVKVNNDYGADTEITEFQYWFDSNFQGAASIMLTGSCSQTVDILIPASALPNGLHMLYVRFRDSAGQWSSVTGRFFHKNGSQFSNIPNLVSGYRFWFDQDLSTMISETLFNPLNPFNLMTDIDMTRIWKGMHQLNIQFRDTVGQWSAVFSQMVEKIPFPVAEFSAAPLSVCMGDTVFFTNTSIDGDTYLWDFGDGVVSNDSAAYHVFSAPGYFTVSLTVADTTVMLDSTLVLTDLIYVGTIASPTLTISGSDTVCQGVMVDVSAPSGNLIYLWSNSEDTQIITTGTAGAYSVMMVDALLSSCVSYSDTFVLTVNPVPLLELGQDTGQCGGSLTLDAMNPGADYLWQDSSDEQTFVVTQTGHYSVTVTNDYTCSAADSVHVYIHALPQIDLGPDVIQLQPPVILDAGLGYTQYDWSNGLQTQTITVTVNGTYSVTVTDSNGCQGADTVLVTFTDGIFELDDEHTAFSIFPNPAGEYFRISSVSLLPGSYEILLYDMFGRIVKKGIFNPQYVFDSCEFAADQLPQGCYLVMLKGNASNHSRYLIIQR